MEPAVTVTAIDSVHKNQKDSEEDTQTASRLYARSRVKKCIRRTHHAESMLGVCNNGNIDIDGLDRRDIVITSSLGKFS